jgi:hypothetical protein
MEFADNVLSMIVDFRNKGETLPAIADRLNSMGVNTRRSGRWYASTVSNILKRAPEGLTGSLQSIAIT